MTADGAILRSLLPFLRSLGDVTETDGSDSAVRSVDGRRYDLFVGDSFRFAEIRKSCRAGTAILVTSGLHPRERARVLQRFAAAAGLPASEYGLRDLLAPEPEERSIRAADFILCAGNTVTYNSYLKHGVPKRNVLPVHAGIPGGAVGAYPAPRGGVRTFLYAAPEIGLRQGFDPLYALFADPAVAALPIALHVIGTPASPYYAERIRRLQSVLGGKMTYREAVSPSSPAFAAIARQADFVLYPALDDAQSPAVIGAMSHGAIPIPGRHAGFDFAPLGYMEPEAGRPQHAALLRRAVHLSADEIAAWKRKTIEYVREYHLDCEISLRRSIMGCIGGSLYPKISVTMPIFNKEATIVPLLADLDRALAAYRNAELHLIFDGCVDRTEPLVKRYFAERKPEYAVTYETTPNLFETRTNNIGLRKCTGDYCVIMQDDNYVLDPNLFFEAVQFLEKNRRCAILGCLSGVNFYPRGTRLSGPGQIACTENETYWRQDTRADPSLAHKFFQVDACMRGPLLFRKSFLDKHGLLDEIYAPLYQDDMDICFRAHHVGFKVYCMLGKVENRSLTMARYDAEKNRFFQAVMKRNTDIFYSRWTPSTVKDYSWIYRTPIAES
jgi:GT2 family glycosyltransferase